MTDPRDLLDEWQEVAESAKPFHHPGGVDPAMVGMLASDLLALVAAVRAVLKEHEESWSCGNPRHTNPEVGCPDCWTECDICGCTYPCVTVMAIRDALGGAQ